MNVLIADKFEAAGIEQLQVAGCKVTQDPDLSGDTLVATVGRTGCNILIVRSTRVTPDVIDAAGELKLIIRAGAGYDTIDTAAAAAKGIRVANCPGMNSTAVAELAMGLIIALDRRIVHNAVDLRAGIWHKKEYGKARGLKGRTLGIVGLGRIGVLLARRARAFEMNLIYCDVVANETAERELGIRKVKMDTLLRESDFVSLHTPGGEETKHLLSTEQFALMKPAACVINCSRGGVVDEQALAQAIASGRIRGAGLDVYEIEPGASDREFSDPVVKADMVYGTHHIGASTEQAQLAVAEETVRIVKTFKETGEVLNCVN
ncbi:MAG: hydroxyacid dehydrogenase [Phycisphaerales bacterium]|nr:MAG: hydroxyacid dehydrogenase [Phycisphaerales bacterium]